MSAKVCQSFELEHETAAGWKLREIVVMDEQEQGLGYSSQEILPGNNYPSYVSKTSPPVVVRRALFVLERDPESDLAMLHEQLLAANERARQAEATAKELEEERKRVQHKLVDVTEACARAQQMADRDQKSLGLLRTSNQKLEADIGKIRREVGEARVREILASEPGGEAK